MAFDALENYGEVLDTHGSAKVSLVQITYDRGQNAGSTKLQVEIRRWVNSPKYTGPTREAFSFDSIGQLRSLVTMLETALDDAKQMGELGVQQAALNPTAVARKKKTAAKK